jgi:hypothetical protein
MATTNKALEADEILPPENAAEKLRLARRLLDEVSLSRELWATVRVSDIPECRSNLAACERAGARIRRTYL